MQDIFRFPSINKILHSLFSDIFILAIGILNSILVARALGPYSFGNYILLITTIPFLANILSMGMNVSSGVLVAKDKSKANSLLMHAILLSAIVTVFLFMAYKLSPTIFLNFIFKGIDKRLIQYSLMCVPFYSFQLYWSSIMMGLDEILSLNKFNVCSNIFSLIATVIIFYILKLKLVSLLIFLLFYNAFLLVVCILLLLRKTGRENFYFDFSILKESFCLGFSAHICNIGHYIIFKIDYFLVNYFMGANSTGLYGVAKSLVERLSALAGPVYRVSFPRIVSMSQEASSVLAAKLSRVIIFIYLIIMFLCIALGYWFIVLVYGSVYAPAFKPVIMLLPSTVLLVSTWILNIYLIGHLKRPYVCAAVTWIVFLVSLPLYYVAISFGGLITMASVSTFSYAFLFIGTIIAFSLLSKIPWRNSLLMTRDDLKEAYKYFSPFIQ